MPAWTALISDVAAVGGWTVKAGVSSVAGGAVNVFAALGVDCGVVVNGASTDSWKVGGNFGLSSKGTE